MQTPWHRLWRAMPNASRRTRRLWVVAALTGYPVMTVGYALLVPTGRASSVLWGPIAIVLFSATLAGVVAIYGYARDRASMTADLDERQQRVRDQAWIAAYGLLSAVVIAAIVFLALIASFSGPVTIGMDVLGPIGICLGLYLPILPSAMLAWSEPDLPVDEEETARAVGTAGR